MPENNGEQPEIVVVVKPVIRKQREIIEKAEYNLPDEHRHRNLRRFVNFQNRKGKGLNTLMPPIRIDTGEAERFASAGRYPVFDDGVPADYESSIGGVVENLDMAVSEILGRSSVTQTQASAISEELQRFRELSREANAAQYRAESLTLLADDSRGAALMMSAVAKAGSNASVERLMQESTPSGVKEALAEIAQVASPEEIQQLAEEYHKLSESPGEPDGPSMDQPDVVIDRHVFPPEPPVEPEARVDKPSAPPADQPSAPVEPPPAPADEKTPEELEAERERRAEQARERREARRDLDESRRLEREMFGRELTSKQRRQVLAAKADYWSDKAEEVADNAQEVAVTAARSTRAMRASLENLHGMVRDATLTADALPDSSDAQAQAIVEIAQQEYQDAYSAVNAVYRGAGGVNVALDRALYVQEKTRQANDLTTEVKERVDDLPGEGLPEDVLRRACQLEDTPGTRQVIEGRAQDLRSAVPDWYSDSTRAQRRKDGVEVTTNLAELEIPDAPDAPPLPVDKPGELRPYQKEMLAGLEKAPQNQTALAAAPTGGGKSEVLGHYVKELRDNGRADKVVIMAHRDELIEDLADRVERIVGYRPGIVRGDEREWNRDIIVVSHGTVAANPNAIIPEGSRRPDLMIIDEAHHAGAEGYGKIIDAFNSKRLLGFTATPYRADGKAIIGPGRVFENLICTVDTGDLIDQGYLVPPTVVDVDLTDNEGNQRKPNEASNLPDVYEEAVTKALQNGRRKVIVFVSEATDDDRLSTEIARQTTRAVEDAGLTASTILGTTSKVRRRAAIERFNAQSEGVLVNFGTLNEGFNSPGVDAIVLGRTVGSRGTLAQIIGRGMRRPNADKKDVLVLNYSGIPSDVIKDQVYNQTKSLRGSDGCDVSGSTNTPRAVALRDKGAEQGKAVVAARPRRRGRRGEERAMPGKLPEVTLSRS